MTEVDKPTFYAHIGPLDVIVSVRGRWPYTNVFVMRSGEPVGQVVETLTEQSAIPVRRYFLARAVKESLTAERATGGAL